MKILVTGGAGFIGSHIAQGALEAGYEVAVLDNLSNGKLENIPSGAKFYQVDIRDAAKLEGVFAEFKPDVVSHQAAQASVAISVRDPILDAQCNIIGSLNVLEAAKKYGTQRVIFASTGGAIYGEVPEGQKAHPSWATHPISPYATSKRSTEFYLETYRIQYGLQYTILRYGNVYGPRQDPHGEAGVVAIFARRLLEGKPIKVNARKAFGDGGCVRDYIYVSDVVKANLAAAKGEVTVAVLNVGTGIPSDTLTLAKKLEEYLGVTADLGYGEQRAGDLEYSLLDSSDLEGLVGQTVSLEAGLKETAAWFRAN